MRDARMFAGFAEHELTHLPCVRRLFPRIWGADGMTACARTYRFSAGPGISPDALGYDTKYVSVPVLLIVRAGRC